MDNNKRSAVCNKSEVTIGVCVKNGAEFIGAAIDSIVEQSYPHELLEVIFVDDGSEDRTLSLIRMHASEVNMPVKIFHSTWKGLGHARNMVVTNADGDYILWVDGDMVISKDFVRKLVEFMENHPEVGITKGVQSLDSGGNLLATLETYARAASRLVDYTAEKNSSKALGTGGSIYRIEAIMENGGFDENMRGYGEDFDMELRIRTAGWVLSTTNVTFSDYERRDISWANLWTRYWRRGYFTHYFLHKNKGLLKHYRMLPPVAFLAGVKHASIIFKKTHDKQSFLLPFQYAFKMISYYLGFIESHRRSFQPKS